MRLQLEPAHHCRAPRTPVGKPEPVKIRSPKMGPMHDVPVLLGHDLLHFTRGESPPRAVLDFELREVPIGLRVASACVPGHTLHPREVVRGPTLFFRNSSDRPHPLDLLRVLVDDDQLVALHLDADEHAMTPSSIYLLHLRRSAAVFPEYFLAELQPQHRGFLALVPFVRCASVGRDLQPVHHVARVLAHPRQHGVLRVNPDAHPLVQGRLQSP